MPFISTHFPALATREARIFYFGQFLSLVGTWMQNTVLPYVAYRISGDPLYLGIVGFATHIPTLLFTLPSGVLMERMDKRRLVIIMQSVMMVQAFVLAALALTNRLTIWHIVALAFVLGTANSIEITARQSWFVELVGKAALPNAIALQATIFNVARVIGPALSAPFLLLLSSSGEGWAFFANGASYLFVIVGLLTIRSGSAVSARAQTPSTEKTNRAFLNGARYIRRTPLIAWLVVLSAVGGFFIFPSQQIVPVYARDVLRQVGDTEANVATRNSVLATAQGIGALIAAFSLATANQLQRRGLLLTLGQFGICAAFALISFSRTLPLVALGFVVLGWSVVTTLNSTNTIIQLTVPNELRSRVISAYLWALQGMAPLGSLAIGWLVSHFGAPVSVATQASIYFLVVVAINAYTPVVRRFRSG